MFGLPVFSFAAIAVLTAGNAFGAGPATMAVPTQAGPTQFAAAGPISPIASPEEEQWRREMEQMLIILCIILNCNATSMDANGAGDAKLTGDPLCQLVDTRCSSYEVSGLRAALSKAEIEQGKGAVNRLTELTKMDSGVLGGQRRDRFLGVLAGLRADLAAATPATDLR